MGHHDVGFRFHPKEQELVGYYLHQRAMLGLQFQSDAVIEYPQFYGEEPWIVWEKNGGSYVEEGEPLFFFTTRTKKNPKSSRFHRKVCSGTWSGQVPTNIEDGDRVIGVRRDFRYERGSDPKQNTCWLMQEYELCPTDALVLCTLKKNPRNPPPSTSTTTSTAPPKVDDKKRKGSTVVDSKPKRTKKAETCVEQPSTSCVVNPTIVEETSCEDHLVQLQGFLELDDLIPIDDPLFSVEDYFSGPLDVQDPALQLESSESQTQILDQLESSESRSQVQDQFRDHPYEGCSFMSTLLSTELPEHDQLGGYNNCSLVPDDQWSDCNNYT